MPAKPFEITYLYPEDVQFRRVGDTLSLTLADGTHYPRVVLRSCFPVSDRQSLISVRDASDEEQPEIGIVEEWETLNEQDRDAISAEMNLHYLVPKVQAVRKVREELGFLYWSVDTDKGVKEFVMRNNIISYARQVSHDHWLLIDVNDARYEITRLSDLDSRSQKLVRQFLSL
ncbi:MAG: DUF1854 domain-containing protein [Chloroflexi bacterium]|nr:DUF1854 domain-containing protein [Chloroflexota bacterium]